MTDTEQIQEQYRKMYDAMIRKDAGTLSDILDDSFVLVHPNFPAYDYTQPVFLRVKSGGSSKNKMKFATFLVITKWQ